MTESKQCPTCGTQFSRLPRRSTRQWEAQKFCSRECHGSGPVAGHTPVTFWARVSQGPGCWLWQGRRDSWGRGVLDYDHRPASAHRLAWTFSHGPIPPHHFVRSTCGNKACCRPDHLDLVGPRPPPPPPGPRLPRYPHPETAIRRFWDRVQKAGDDECWLWTGTRDTAGYGWMRRRGRTIKAHRLSWELTHGEIPAGLWVLHHCDNPPCVRPDHLFLGTPADNNRDRDNKGRRVSARGEQNGSARLTAAQVVAIRAASSAGTSAVKLARQYGVGRSTIRSIIHGVTWLSLAAEDKDAHP